MTKIKKYLGDIIAELAPTMKSAATAKRVAFSRINVIPRDISSLHNHSEMSPSRRHQ